MNSIKLLIIDDEEIWSTQLEMIAEKFGFEVVGCFNEATTAIMQLSKIDFDIALLDISMEGKNIGIELGKMITNTYNKPFIFITGSLDQHTANEALAAKPSAYLTKPVNDTSLYVAIQQALNNFEEKQVAQNETAIKSNSFFVKVGNKYKKIEWQKVVALISDKKYTKILVANDNVEYFIGNTLPKTLQNILPPHLQNNFVQINRAEVVNTEYIIELKSTTITTLHQIFEATDGYLPELKNKLNLV